jgi:regulator of sigma E protease
MAMPDFLLKPLAVVVLLGGLIFVHELGHFLFAKLFRVKVDRFSIGFGPPLFSFQRGETEYWIAWLPLGGYVRMAGADPGAEVRPEDRGRGFYDQVPWKRLVISVAGPAMNLVLPFLLIIGLNGASMGKPTVSATIGTVIPASPADRAGLRPDDRILAVTGPDGTRRPTRDFDDLVDQVTPHPGERLLLEVERAGKVLPPVGIEPQADARSNGLETVQRGMIGITPYYAQARVAPVEPGVAGPVQPFDLVLAVDGKPVPRAIDLTAALSSAGCRPVELEVLRDRPVELPGAVLAGYTRERLTGVPTCTSGAPSLRVVDPSLVAAVAAVVPGGPAARAGLRRGDVITAVNGRQVHTAWELENVIRAELGDYRPGTLTLADGRTVPITAEKMNVEGAIQRKDAVQPTLGIRTTRQLLAGDALVVPSVKLERTVPEILHASAVGTIGQARMLVLVLGKMLTREVDTSNIGGPLQIVQETSKAVDAGWERFVEMMAAISVNLGVINLLPIPVLDGGNIAQALVETITRRRLSLRTREVATVIGVILLVSLFLLATKNDLGRLLRQLFPQ